MVDDPVMLTLRANARVAFVESGVGAAPPLRNEEKAISRRDKRDFAGNIVPRYGGWRGGGG